MGFLRGFWSVVMEILLLKEMRFFVSSFLDAVYTLVPVVYKTTLIAPESKIPQSQ